MHATLLILGLGLALVCGPQAMGHFLPVHNQKLASCPLLDRKPHEFNSISPPPSVASLDYRAVARAKGFVTFHEPNKYMEFETRAVKLDPHHPDRLVIDAGCVTMILFFTNNVAKSAVVHLRNSPSGHSSCKIPLYGPGNMLTGYHYRCLLRQTMKCERGKGSEMSFRITFTALEYELDSTAYVVAEQQDYSLPALECPTDISYRDK